jgi:hypothetical protein
MNGLKPLMLFISPNQLYRRSIANAGPHYTKITFNWLIVYKWYYFRAGLLPTSQEKATEEI